MSNDNDYEIDFKVGSARFSLESPPSLLKILQASEGWKRIYDTVEGGLKGLMTENVIDHFHAHSIETVDRLNHAGYTPSQICLETGLMPVKVDGIFETLGIDKSTESPSRVMGQFTENMWMSNKLPVCHLWEVDHSYYCETDYDEMKFASFAEFLEAMGKADKDYNFLFRWDWDERDYETDTIIYKGDNNERTGTLKLCYQAQRKGFSMRALVKVCRNDEPAVRAYLEDHWKYMENMWAPISPGVSERVKEEDLAPRTPEQLMRNQYFALLDGAPEESQAMLRQTLGDYNPYDVEWVRHQFTVQPGKGIPVLFPPIGPFWELRTTHYGVPYQMVAYLPKEVPVEKYWPEYSDLTSTPVEHITLPQEGVHYQGEFRVNRPKWWPFD